MENPEIEPRPSDEDVAATEPAGESEDNANPETEARVYTLDNLPEVCDFFITDEARNLTPDDLPQYLDSAAEQLAGLAAEDSTEYQRYSIGLFLHVGIIKHHAGDIVGALQDFDEAYTHAENMGWTDIMDAIKQVGRSLEDALYGDGVDPSAPTPDGR